MSALNNEEFVGRAKAWANLSCFMSGNSYCEPRTIQQWLEHDLLTGVIVVHFCNILKGREKFLLMHRYLLK